MTCKILDLLKQKKIFLTSSCRSTVQVKNPFVKFHEECAKLRRVKSQNLRFSRQVIFCESHFVKGKMAQLKFQVSKLLLLLIAKQQTFHDFAEIKLLNIS
jgi:hypothetical protein